MHDAPPTWPAPAQPSWWQLAHPSAGHAALRHDVDAQVCVIGGGITGVSCAWHLARRGAEVVLLEARSIAGGASGRNGGFLLAGLQLRPELLASRVGRRRARELRELTEQARDDVFRTATSIGTPWAARRTGSMRLATDDHELTALRAEHDLLASDGFDVDWLEQHELPGRLRHAFPGGLRFPGDGASHPAAWVRELARDAARLGAVLHEHSPVRAIVRDGTPVLVHTRHGSVRAPAVVVCTEAWLPGLLPELRGIVTPYRSQVLATAPLEPATVLECPTWSRHGLDYAQQAQTGHLVVGGECADDPARYATWEEAVDDAEQAHLDAWLHRVLAVDPVVEARWGGVLGMSRDELPLVGAVPGRPGVFVAGGWGGAGNVMGFAGGRMLAMLLAGRTPGSPDHAVPAEFNPRRLLA